MQFSDELEFNTFSDAWKTPKTFYNATRERKVNISNNKKILLLIAPRGLADIKSIQYHMKSTTVPPVFVEWKTKDGVRTIFLDGMHQIVAASISKKRKIPIFLIINYNL